MENLPFWFLDRDCPQIAEPWVGRVTARGRAPIWRTAGISSLRPSRGSYVRSRIDPAGRSGPTQGHGVRAALEADRAGDVRSGSRGGQPGRAANPGGVRRRGPRAVVTGWAGLRLLGGGWFDGLAGDGRDPAARADRGERRPAPSRPGVLVVPTPVRTTKSCWCTAFDALRRAGLVRRDATARVNRPRRWWSPIDMACAGRLTSIRRMRRYCATRRWYRDVRIVTDPLSMAVEGSRSGPETKFRIVWEYDAGWGRPLVNRELFDQSKGASSAFPISSTRSGASSVSSPAQTTADRRTASSATSSARQTSAESDSSMSRSSRATCATSPR